ncbi:MAG: RsmE family RNA methyltransferase [Candidatus Marinimicrobia bacterium]|nr:RsmE family RNA methyltransferase [Candidatus Neomarinimicrobiota bacterium]
MAERHHFILSDNQIEDGRFHLNGDEAHHLSNVARIGVGDEVYLIDTRGKAYRAAVDSISEGAVRGPILDMIQGYHEPTVNIHLGIAILKGARLDLVSEKGTELGVASVTPLILKRNVKKGVNRNRLTNVARSAAKQCGRGRVPEINEPASLSEWCQKMKAGCGALLHNSDAAKPMVDWLRNLPDSTSDVWLAVGPEGGFENEELQPVLQLGLEAVSLGKRRLRSETAALSALTIVDHCFTG